MGKYVRQFEQEFIVNLWFEFWGSYLQVNSDCRLDSEMS